MQFTCQGTRENKQREREKGQKEKKKKKEGEGGRKKEKRKKKGVIRLNKRNLNNTYSHTDTHADTLLPSV